jgi:hypothetical protein
MLVSPQWVASATWRATPFDCGMTEGCLIYYAFNGINSAQAQDSDFAELALARLKCDPEFNTAGPSSHSRTGRFSLLS